MLCVSDYLLERLEIVPGDKLRAFGGRVDTIGGELGRCRADTCRREQTVQRDEHIGVLARELSCHLNLRVEVYVEELPVGN